MAEDFRENNVAAHPLKGIQLRNRRPCNDKTFLYLQTTSVATEWLCATA
jgi:hypothetical protein